MSDNTDPVPSEPLAETESVALESGRRANWLLWALPVLAVLALVGIWYSSRPAPVPLQGTVEATEVNVATKMMARVEQVSVAEGATVSPGQLLATLSSPGLDALVSQSQANLDSARALDAIANQGVRPEDIASLQGIAASTRAAANLAAVTAGRMSRLYAQGVISAQRRDEAVAANIAARANAAAADAQYRKALAGTRGETRAISDAQAIAAKARNRAASELAADMKVAAPIAGEVSRRHVEPGEVVAPGVPLFQIVDLAHPRVTLRISEKDYAGMAQGRVLTGTVPALGNKAVRLRVTAISAQAGFTSEKATRQNAGFDVRSFEIKLEPAERIEGLRPGMSVLFDWPQ